MQLSRVVTLPFEHFCLCPYMWQDAALLRERCHLFLFPCKVIRVDLGGISPGVCLYDNYKYSVVLWDYVFQLQCFLTDSGISGVPGGVA